MAFPNRILKKGCYLAMSFLGLLFERVLFGRALLMTSLGKDFFKNIFEEKFSEFSLEHISDKKLLLAYFKLDFYFFLAKKIWNKNFRIEILNVFGETYPNSYKRLFVWKMKIIKENMGNIVKDGFIKIYNYPVSSQNGLIGCGLSSLYFALIRAIYFYTGPFIDFFFEKRN
ncbi:hypothetical protein BpHYR1_002156 [Brachionus plicatilis]|uniref:Uncharacterized protein n=1 Tax=Brachionus plicatilis TaxID=10195 RepID=A0A3M7PZD9_BRAPC|nr:hypothetical protein BpHYR1_002156 [Brachionus plicatilis]